MTSVPRRVLSVLLMLTMALTAAGCTRAPRPDGSWGATAAAPATSSTQLPSDLSSVEFNIMGTELTGSNGCGPIRARVELADGTLRVSDLQVATIGCPPEATALATYVEQVLTAAPRAEIQDGEMTLTAPAGTLTLRRQ